MRCIRWVGIAFLVVVCGCGKPVLAEESAAPKDSPQTVLQVDVHPDGKVTVSVTFEAGDLLADKESSRCDIFKAFLRRALDAAKADAKRQLKQLEADAAAEKDRRKGEGESRKGTASVKG
jgi:hypothetical protein